MATMTEMFKKTVNLAIENSKMVTDPTEKAKIYAQIASAIASTGLVTEISSQAETVKEEKPSGREALKKENKVIPVEVKKTTTEEAPEVKEVPVEKEEPVEQEEEKPRDVTVKDTFEDPYWEKHFAKEIQYLQEAIETYGEDDVNEAVKLFSQNNYNSVDDIQPFNIVAFVTFLKEMAEED